jgi:hypothetical protein
MNVLQTIKTLGITPPAAIVDNAAFATATIDRRGFNALRIVVFLGAIDIAVAAFKLRESNSSDMTGATDVPDADFSIAPATLPAATDDNKLFAIFVNLKGRKRDLDLSLTGGDGAAGTFAAAWADLADAEEVPDSAADRGFAQELIA